MPLCSGTSSNQFYYMGGSAYEFLVSSDAVAFGGAVRQCAAYGADLASIASAEEHQYILDLQTRFEYVSLRPDTHIRCIAIGGCIYIPHIHSAPYDRLSGYYFRHNLYNFSIAKVLIGLYRSHDHAQCSCSGSSCTSCWDTYMWLDKSSLNYYQWKTSEPNNRARKCVAADSGGFEDSDCSAALPYVCKRKLKVNMFQSSNLMN